MNVPAAPIAGARLEVVRADSDDLRALAAAARETSVVGRALPFHGAIHLSANDLYLAVGDGLGHALEAGAPAAVRALLADALVVQGEATRARGRGALAVAACSSPLALVDAPTWPSRALDVTDPAATLRALDDLVGQGSGTRLFDDHGLDAALSAIERVGESWRPEPGASEALPTLVWTRRARSTTEILLALFRESDDERWAALCPVALRRTVSLDFA